MIPERIQELQRTRSQLWAAACRREITVVELYAALAKLRAEAGADLYEVPRFGRPKR
jgi:hypothetical protein